MRRKHAHISDGRLAAVLFFTGWIPLASKGPLGGFFGFLVAVVLLRHWVARHDDHLPLSYAAALVATLAAVVLSYGLLHPLWTAQVIPTASAAKQNRSVEVLVHNAARADVTIENLRTDFFVRGPRPSRLHLAPGADGVVVLSIPGSGGCGTAVVGLNARYHVFGLSLSETLPARISLGRHC